MRLRVISTRPSSEILVTLALALSCLERLLERAHHLLAVLLFVHVDEVDDDHAADVAQAQLVGDLLARLEVGLGDGLLEARLPTNLPVLTSMAVSASP